MKNITIIFMSFLIVAGLAFAVNLTAAPGDVQKLGTFENLKNTRAVAVERAKLFSVTKSGKLYVTDLLNLKSEQIGSDRFSSVKWLFATGGGLLGSIETGGSLYSINRSTGDMKLLGAPGDWKDTVAAFGFDGKCFAVDRYGPVYVIPLATGRYQQLGSVSLNKSTLVLVGPVGLLSFDSTGTLFVAGLADGAKRQVGETGAFKGLAAAAIASDRLWTVDSAGMLYVTDLATGKQVKTGPGGLQGVNQLVSFGDALFALDDAGTLYKISTK
jgi:hypothetical protein